MKDKLIEYAVVGGFMMGFGILWQLVEGLIKSNDRMNYLKELGDELQGIGTGILTLASVGTLILILITIFAAWMTHIFDCFSHGQWGFLLVGALFVPLAVIHGFGIWFGFWPG